MTMIEKIRTKLFELRDLEFHAFHSKLIPTVDPDCLIGVRTPHLRKLAKELIKENKSPKEIGTQATCDISLFLDKLPHKYFEENQLHIFILSEMKDYEACIKKVDEFLPYINNWATCDQLSPKVFKNHKSELIEAIDCWIEGRHFCLDKPIPPEDSTYVIRFGIGMLMEHFLDEDFKIDLIEKVASIKSNEYYINMMIAWNLATALAKQWDATIPLLEGKFPKLNSDNAQNDNEIIKLDDWVHNKTIQKAIESKRITPEQKAYLRTLKR